MYGYKVLEWQDNKLISPLYKAEWRFGVKSIAACAWGGNTGIHAVPDKECRCGIYATKDAFASTPYMRGVAHLLVLGWASGKTIIGENGYRCAEWEPTHIVDISAIEAESDLMWETAHSRMGKDISMEITLYILGLEGAKKRSKEQFAANRLVRERLHAWMGVPVIDLAQAEILIGDSWAK